MSCKQFFEDGILDRDYCIYVNSSLTNKQFRTQFSNIENQNLIQNSKFINPYLYKCVLSKQVQILLFLVIHQPSPIIKLLVLGLVK